MFMKYKSNGKKYNNEKAIISLTSWTARINTVSKTIFSLLTKCPGFHIVLVLSEDEFPKKELPENLMMFVKNKLIELLWIKPNLKSFKKILFTLDKYKTVPVISADDDCIYTCNYAQELYDKWCTDKTAIVSYKNESWENIDATWGCATLYPPYYFGEDGIKHLTQKVIDIGFDDNYYLILRKKLNLLKCLYINKNILTDNIIVFHDELDPLKELYIEKQIHQRTYNIYNTLLSIDGLD